MARVTLQQMDIENFGPIKRDHIDFDTFTYFVGRNNAGKSHYLKAIEVLLASSMPKAQEVEKWQHDKTSPIVITGVFTGVGEFTHILSGSNHKTAIDESIHEGQLTVIRQLDQDKSRCAFGIVKDGDDIHNPSGFATNLLKVLPEPISILATADTVDELKNTQYTALSKLKREALSTFLADLKEKTQETLVELDQFLHADDESLRSQEIITFERRLQEELVGEFAEVVPTIKFTLPTEEVIAKEMKIFLDDGHNSEVEQKGHGLQRATLLALLKVLAKHGKRFQNRPAPMFLIGELESFLHPYAQRQFASVLTTLVANYQVITTTHSPFIIKPDSLCGYRRVTKDGAHGTRSTKVNTESVNVRLVQRHLERRGDLEGLFADRIVLIEGDHDEEFFRRAIAVLNIQTPEGKFILFVKAGGKEELRQSRKFYGTMGFDDVSIVCDLDYLFSNDIKHLLRECGVAESYALTARQHIGWTGDGDPSLATIRDSIQSVGYPSDFDTYLAELAKQRIFVFRRGAPEDYYKETDRKDGWQSVSTEDDLLEADFLRGLLSAVLS